MFDDALTKFITLPPVSVSGIYNISSVFSIKVGNNRSAFLESRINNIVSQQRTFNQNIDPAIIGYEYTITMDINYTTLLNSGDEVYISLYGSNAVYGLTNRHYQQLNIIRLACIKILF